MKNRKGTMKRALTALIASASLLKCHAAVPMPPWTVDTARAQPAQFEAYQGETLTFEAALTCRGKPIEAPSNYSIFWQTNGMGRYYWEAPAKGEAASSPLVGTNVLFATWLPSYDCGAKVYNCFIGSPSNNYHAAFQLRLRPSPGATPNALPLPTPVIDFAKVRVLNPPWSGGGGGVDTNAVRDIIHETVDGAARPLPKYLHLYNADDSYPDAAAEYYRQRGSGVPSASCSSVRDGGFLFRNFDYPYDNRAEFVVKMSAGKDRFASVGVAQVGTNLTEQIVTSGKPEYSRLYKWLPGATVDGVNENGVACNINVVDGDPQTSGWHNDTGDIHPLSAIRWILDHATNAQHAATYISSHIAFPQGWEQNFHYMIADEEKTYIVENGSAYEVPSGQPMTNYPLFSYPYDGSGLERMNVLMIAGSSITNVWYTNAYSPDTSWESDFGYNDTLMATSKVLWAQKPKEAHRGESVDGYTWWQTVHTSIYDLTNRTLRVAVQETDDWYVFQVPSSGAKVDAYTKDEVEEKIGEVRSIATLAEDNAQNAWASSQIAKNLANAAQASADIAMTNADAKIAKVQNPVAGNLASLTADGYLADTGIHARDGGIDSIGFITGAGAISGTMIYIDGGWDLGTLGDRFQEHDVDSDIHVTQDEKTAWNAKADRSMISATNETFAAEVLAVQVASLSTNITAEVYIAATNACANLGIDPALIPGAGTTGTVGGLIVTLFAVVFWMRKKIFDNSGKVNDTFAGELLGKPVAKEAIDNRTKASASAITGDALTLPDGGVVSAESSAPTITFGTARQTNGLRFCELYLTNPDAAADGAIVSISGKVYSDISLTDLPKLEKGATYYFTFAEFKVTQETVEGETVSVSHWKVSKQKLDAMGGDIPTPTAA